MRTATFCNLFTSNSAANMQELLLGGTAEPSFAKRNATFDGVCMGNRKTCSCGDPFFT